MTSVHRFRVSQRRDRAVMTWVRLASKLATALAAVFRIGFVEAERPRSGRDVGDRTVLDQRNQGAP